MALTKQNVKRLAVGFAAVSSIALAGVSPALASEPDAPETTAAAPETTAAAPEATDAAAEGKTLDVELTPGTTCVVTVRNQFSVHPNTDVEVTVGDDVYVLSDVESEADKVTTSDAITVGDDGATVFVKFGADGKSSLSVDNVTCEAPTPTAIEATPTFTG